MARFYLIHFKVADIFVQHGRCSSQWLEIQREIIARSLIGGLVVIHVVTSLLPSTWSWLLLEEFTRRHTVGSRRRLKHNATGVIAQSSPAHAIKEKLVIVLICMLSVNL